MDSLQLRRCLSRDTKIRRFFRDVLPSDWLPKRVSSRPSAYVINTDPSHREGLHWVSVVFRSGGESVYFDPLGLPPTILPIINFINRNSERVVINRKVIQNITSKSCGQICVAFLFFISRGYTLEQLCDFLLSNQDPDSTAVAIAEGVCNSPLS